MSKLRAPSLRRIGGYQLDECLFSGATTHVYLARSPTGPGPLAIKLLSPALSVSEELVARFREEAELSLELRHPNVPEAYATGCASGIPYLAMELLDGLTLEQLLAKLAARGQRLPIGAALTIARDACRALGYAHHFVDGNGVHRQIIHGDVSPPNLFVCGNGVIKLIDFGGARVAGAFDFDVTASGEGMHAYMAPEQARGEPIDRRVDVFALGAVLHEMLTGQPLFASRTPLESMRRVAAAEVDLPSRQRPELPRLVDGITRRALARDRAQRYPSGAAMGRALESLAGLLFSRRRMGELVREYLDPREPASERRAEDDTVPIEGVPEAMEAPDTVRVEVR